MNDVNRPAWLSLSTAKQEELARAMLPALPAGFEFLDVVWHELGGHSHPIAEFRFDDCRFCMIPGDTVTLGYDRQHPFRLQRKHKLHGGPKLAELAEEIVQNTTPLRNCTLQPLLVEAIARPLGVRRYAPDAPEVKELLGKYDRGYPVLDFYGDDFRLRRDKEGRITLRRGAFFHSQAVAEFAAAGFRLPTNDEWEYLCGAGARTLFRWGDDCPCDRYPQDKLADAEIVERLRNWNAGDPPWEPEQWEWDKHRRPNAFGLQVAQDPYHREVTASAGVFRGGDAGRSFCGGASYFQGWLPLANCYIERTGDSHDPDVAELLGRRVLTCSPG